MLIDSVSKWCRRVEFPIRVQEPGLDVTISSERKEQFTYEVPDVAQKGRRLAVRAFDIQRPGVEGELYVFVRADGNGESWNTESYALDWYAKRDPRASQLPFPELLVCVRGIQATLTDATIPTSARIDFRGANIPPMALSREYLSMRGLPGALDPGIRSRWIELLNAHLASSELAKGPDGWKYKQKLVDNFKLAGFWNSMAEMVPIHTKLRTRLVSMKEVLAQPKVAIILAPHEPSFEVPHDREGLSQPYWNEEIWAIFGDEFAALSSAHRQELFEERSISAGSWLATEHFLMFLQKDTPSRAVGNTVYKRHDLVELPSPLTVGFEVHPSRSHVDRVLLNASNPLIQWMLRVKSASAKSLHGLNAKHYKRLEELFCEACDEPWDLDDAVEYIKKWRQIRELPADLYPPKLELLSDMFLRIPYSDK